MCCYWTRSIFEVFIFYMITAKSNHHKRKFVFLVILSIFLNFISFFVLCLCVYLYVDLCTWVQDHRGQKRIPDCLDLELQAVVIKHSCETKWTWVSCKKQYVLITTKISLQPLLHVIYSAELISAFLLQGWGWGWHSPTF